MEKIATKVHIQCCKFDSFFSDPDNVLNGYDVMPDSRAVASQLVLQTITTVVRSICWLFHRICRRINKFVVWHVEDFIDEILFEITSV